MIICLQIVIILWTKLYNVYNGTYYYVYLGVTSIIAVKYEGILLCYQLPIVA